MDQANETHKKRESGIRGIAVVRNGAIGDTVVLFPLLAALRAEAATANKYARILAIGRTEAWEVARRHGLCDRVMSPDAAGWWRFAAGGLEPDARFFEAFQGIERLIDFDSGREPGSAAVAGVARHDVFEALPPAGFGAPAARYYLNCAGFDKYTNHAPDFIYLSGSQNHLAAQPGDFFVISPGAGSESKRAPAEWFAGVSRDLSKDGVPVALVSGEADARAVQEFREAGGVCDARFHGLPLAELTAHFCNIRGFLANDSGIAHLAAAAGAHGIVIFTKSDPAVWAPPSPRVRSLRAEAMSLELIIKESGAVARSRIL